MKRRPRRNHTPALSLHRRGNAGIVWVRQPGDYATFNSYQPRYATCARALLSCAVN
jgi:hypothetical protein